MMVAAKTLAVAAIELFENPAEVAAAKAAFDKRLAGRSWVTRIKPTDKPLFDFATR